MIGTGRVKITVRSSQLDTAAVTKMQAEQGDLEVISFGRLTEKNGKWYVVYEESETTGFAGTRTILKWDRERLLVLRSGTLEHRQEFYPGLKMQMLYKTPYLTIPMEVRTKTLTIRGANLCWDLTAEYDLIYGEQEDNHICLHITIEEDRQ